jgi:hypothetical protein
VLHSHISVVSEAYLGLGWKLEISGPDGGPIQLERVDTEALIAKLDKLTDAQLKELVDCGRQVDRAICVIAPPYVA